MKKSPSSTSKKKSQLQKKSNNSCKRKLNEEDTVTKAGKRNTKHSRQKGKITELSGRVGKDQIGVTEGVTPNSEFIQAPELSPKSKVQLPSIDDTMDRAFHEPTSQQQTDPNDAYKGTYKEEATVAGRRNTNDSRQKGKKSALAGKADNDPMSATEETMQILGFTSKFVLQLIPMDGITRRVLKEDGYNPHFQLTLGGRKKISSVVKHLISKWGSSRVAVGELKLFPYNTVHENTSVCKTWSVKDMEISVADVHKAMGCPSIFRLRYGWFLDVQPTEVEQDQDKLSSMLIVDDKERPCLENNQEFPIQETGDLPSLPDKSSPSDRDVDDTHCVKANKDAGIPWDDGLTNISFRDLLIRASLIPSEATQTPQLPVGTNSRSLHVSFSCDSFDAAIAAQLSRMQDPNQPANASISSIFDADETCHHFPFQKKLPKGEYQQPSGNVFASSTQDVLPPNISGMGGKSLLGIEEPCVKEEALPVPLQGGKSFLDIEEPCVKEEALPVFQSQQSDTVCDESTPGETLQPVEPNCSENCLDLGNIAWESLGPMDLCLPSTTVISGNESISFGGLLFNSRDGHRSCSFDTSDKINSSSLKLHL